MTKSRPSAPRSAAVSRPLNAAAHAAGLVAGLAGTLALATFASGLGGCAPAASVRPIVIGHRGASGYRPEHTLASYTLAIEQGADYIEPDLVSTKDGILVARHENEIGSTTDAAQRFPDRKTTKQVDGSPVEGWFVEDLTLAELKTLRARERLPFRDHQFDGQFEIPTFEEVLDLMQKKTAETGRAIGIYPETKHPTYFTSIGLPLEEKVVAALHARGFTEASAPVFIQSFELGSLKKLRALTKLKLVMLLGEESERPYDLVTASDTRTYGDLAKPAGLAEIARIASGIGPSKTLLWPAMTNGRLLAPSTLVTDAHAQKLLVHPYTFRKEELFISPDHRFDPIVEMTEFLKLGIDGMFTDFPDLGVQARDQALAAPPSSAQ